MEKRENAQSDERKTNEPKIGDKIRIQSYDYPATILEGTVRRIRSTGKLVVDTHHGLMGADYLRPDGVWGYKEEEESG